MWPQMTRVKEEMALEKHKQRLSEFKGSIPKGLEDYISNVSSKIFSRINRLNAPATKFLPSGSSCLQASRRKGGALSLIQKFQFPTEELEKKIGKLPALNLTLNTWRQTQFNHCLEKARERLNQFSRVNNKGQFFSEKVDLPASHVKVLAIPEPGKFRIITKGDGYLYSALQPLQGLLLKAWKKTTYSTMLHDDLLEKVQKIDETIPNELDGHEFFLGSVDWEAATDLLKKDATLAVMRNLRNVPLSDLAWTCLVTPGVAEYSRVDYKKGPDGEYIKECSTLNGVPQGEPDYVTEREYKEEIEIKEGQLMGHPLSFPILCVINLAVYQYAIKVWIDESIILGVEDFGEEYKFRSKIGKLMKHNVIVNGDDMLFKSTKSFHDLFLKLAALVGFKVSQGKNYLSPHTCMINSQTYSRRNGVMKRFGYLNLRIVKGTNIKLGSKLVTPTQISREVSKMVKMTSWTKSVIPAVMNRWKDDKSGSFKPNWYIPPHLGGYGMDISLAPETMKITRSQREMAARFVSDPSLALYRLPEIGDFKIPMIRYLGAVLNWRMIPDDYVRREGESDLLSDEWLGRIAFAARAHSGAEISDDDINVPKIIRFLRHKKQFRLKPMSIEGIERYWNAQVFAFSGPICPPLVPLRIKNNLLKKSRVLRLKTKITY